MGVVSTTPIVVSTWATPLTTPSSAEGVFVVPRGNDVTSPTQRLSHALGGPAARSRHMSVVAPVSAPLAQSSGHGLGVNKSPSSQGAKGKEAMEIDDNDLGHLSYGLELDNIDDDLPNSTIVRDDHDLASEGDEIQEDMSHSSVTRETCSRRKQLDTMETEDDDIGHCTHRLDFNNVADDLSQLRFVSEDHDLGLEGNQTPLSVSHSSSIAPVSTAKTINSRPPRQRRPPPTKTARRKAVTDKYAML